jgi:predicted ATP-grasp superfamily ATP-dependent carboligase
VVGLALELGAQLVVGLGAYPAAVPHTRASQLSATASTPELARAVGFVPGTIDVPGGVHAAIEREAAAAGLPAIGLWAQVPHYAAGLPYPAASIALIDGLRQVAGLDFGTGNLAEEAAATRARLDALIANSDEHQALVRQLEVQADERQELPSGDELAAEVERFLRDRNDPGSP